MEHHNEKRSNASDDRNGFQHFEAAVCCSHLTFLAIGVCYAAREES
jgi:hypothetical protein